MKNTSTEPSKQHKTFR